MLRREMLRQEMQRWEMLMLRREMLRREMVRREMVRREMLRREMVPAPDPARGYRGRPRLGDSRPGPASGVPATARIPPPLLWGLQRRLGLGLGQGCG